jgi:hypothetical protein
MDIAARSSNMGIEVLTKMSVSFSKAAGSWVQCSMAGPGPEERKDTAMGQMVGPMKAKDREGDLFHWRLELRTTNWLKLAHVHGDKWTARELYSYYHSIPVLIAGKRAGKNKVANQNRLAAFVAMQIKSKD